MQKIFKNSWASPFSLMVFAGFCLWLPSWQVSREINAFIFAVLGATIFVMKSNFADLEQRLQKLESLSNEENNV